MESVLPRLSSSSSDALVIFFSDIEGRELDFGGRHSRTNAFLPRDGPLLDEEQFAATAAGSGELSSVDLFGFPFFFLSWLATWWFLIFIRFHDNTGFVLFPVLLLNTLSESFDRLR